MDRRPRNRLALVSLCCASIVASHGWTREPPPGSFAYVLQADRLADARTAAVARLARSRRDWIILDADGDGETPWSKDELTRIRHERAGRKVLAYLSIGEAENYRSYWRPAWRRSPPPFLMEENEDWPGNYRVKFWMPTWQAIILRQVDRVMAQGFDGLYLDKVDVFEAFEYDRERRDWIDHRINRATGRSYRADMAAWVRRVAERARRHAPGALIVPQNGSQLLDERSYRKLIDGIGVEDLYTDGERKQDRDDTKEREGRLKSLVASGKAVLCVDYSKQPAWRRYAALRAWGQGYSFLTTDRELTRIGKSLEHFGYLGPGYHNRTKRFTPRDEMRDDDWSDPREIKRSWEAALVRIPGRSKGKMIRTTMGVLSEGRVRVPDGKWPTVVYLHGCAGVWPGTYRRIDWLAANGFAVVAPVSLARRKYPRSCDVRQHRGGLYRPTLRMRQLDAAYAIAHAKQLRWVDPQNVFLMGLSQGGITTATLRTDDPATRVNARVVEGWTCHAGWEEYRGINAPPEEPVLTLVGARDPWFQHRWNRGDCGVFLDKTNGSRSVVFRSPPLRDRHELLEAAEARQIVLDFLNRYRKRTMP